MSAQDSLLAPEPGPATLIEVPWGGRRLARLRRASPDRPIGESWEFCTLPGRESRVAGRSLPELLGRPLPFLVKLLDTAQPLSLQVHPAGPERGKEEAWIILDAAPGASLLVGIAPEARAHFGALARAVEAGTAPGEALLAALQRVPVQPGAVVLVPGGTVHAVTAGIFLVEIQQPRDCTYRLYDHGRGRALQLDEGLEALVASSTPRVWQPGELPGQLRGAHLELRVLGPGRHRIPERRDWLVVAVTGDAEVCTSREHARLSPGDLRLCVEGWLELDVSSSGQVVVGCAA